MADTDDIRDGKNFGLDTPASTEGFYLKGINNSDWGLKNRMSRIFNKKSGRTVMLAFDHGFLMGPTSGLERIDLNIAPLAEEADCLMGTRGMLRTSIPPTCVKPVCLRTDTGTTILTQMNFNVLIAEEEAINMNASAMAAMLSVGEAETEALTIANFSRLVDIGNKYERVALLDEPHRALRRHGISQNRVLVHARDRTAHYALILRVARQFQRLRSVEMHRVVHLRLDIYLTG